MSGSVVDELRRRAESGAPRGADSVWRAAVSEVAGRQRRRPALLAVVLVVVAGLVGVFVVATRDQGSGPDTETAALPEVGTSDTAGAGAGEDGEPVGSLCPIVVLNVVGEPGIATAQAGEIAAYLADSGHVAAAADADVTAGNASSFDVEVDDAVLLPREPGCEVVALEGRGPVVDAPWPEEYADAVPDAVAPAAMVVVIGELASESALVAVVDVVGLDPAEATAWLSALGFEVEPLLEAPDPTEIVLATDPEPGTSVAAGTAVTLVVGDPPPAQPTPLAVATLDEIAVVPCDGSPEVPGWVEYRGMSTPQAPRGPDPVDAATQFAAWIDGQPNDLDGFRITPLYDDWTEITAADGAIAFGWRAASTEGPAYNQLLYMTTDGQQWWVAEYRTSGC